MSEVFDELRAAIEAVCVRDPERAELATRVHLDSVIKMLTAFAASTPYEGMHLGR